MTSKKNKCQDSFSDCLDANFATSVNSNVFEDSLIMKFIVACQNLC